MNRIFFLSCAFFYQTICFGIGEAEIPKRKPLLQEFFDSGPTRSFLASEGIPISWKSFPQKDRLAPSVIISTGRTEPFEKYVELTWDLFHVGFQVFLFDHRGQGGSGRVHQNPLAGHVDRYENYTKDLIGFSERVRRMTKGRLFLLGHSMGGAIALSAGANAKNNLYDGVIVSAPMLAIKTGIFPRWLAKLSAMIAVKWGYENSFALGQKALWHPLPNEKTSSSTLRRDWAHQVLVDRPNLRLGGITFGWLHQAIRMGSDAFNSESTVPLLMFSAGIDHWVDAETNKNFCKKNPRCQLIEFPKSRHEVFFEVDDIRTKAINSLAKFVNSLD